MLRGGGMKKTPATGWLMLMIRHKASQLCQPGMISLMAATWCTSVWPSISIPLPWRPATRPPVTNDDKLPQNIQKLHSIFTIGYNYSKELMKFYSTKHSLFFSSGSLSKFWFIVSNEIDSTHRTWQTLTLPKRGEYSRGVNEGLLHPSLKRQKVVRESKKRVPVPRSHRKKLISEWIIY